MELLAVICIANIYHFLSVDSNKQAQFIDLHQYFSQFPKKEYYLIFWKKLKPSVMIMVSFK